MQCSTAKHKEGVLLLSNMKEMLSKKKKDDKANWKSNNHSFTVVQEGKHDGKERRWKEKKRRKEATEEKMSHPGFVTS